jgi:hypothetical protein
MFQGEARISHLGCSAVCAHPKIQNAHEEVNDYPLPLTNSNQNVIQKITSIRKAFSFNPFL